MYAWLTFLRHPGPRVGVPLCRNLVTQDRLDLKLGVSTGIEGRTCGTLLTIEDIRNLPSQIEGVLNAGVGSKTVRRRMAMDSISQAENISLGILLTINMVDIPLTHIQNLNLDRLITDDLHYPLHPLLTRRQWVRRVALHRKHDEHPFVPRPDHPREPDPRKIWVLNVMLVTPVKTALSMGHEFAEIGFDEDIPREAAPRVLLERQVKLANNLTTSAIRTEQIPASDYVLCFKNQVFD